MLVSYIEMFIQSWQCHQKDNYVYLKYLVYNQFKFACAITYSLNIPLMF